MDEQNRIKNTLQKCSKEELIRIIIMAAGYKYSNIRWTQLIAEAHLPAVEKAIATNTENGKKLDAELQAMKENADSYSTEDFLEIHRKMNANLKEWEKLNRQYDRITGEIYS